MRNTVNSHIERLKTLAEIHRRSIENNGPALALISEERGQKIVESSPLSLRWVVAVNGGTKQALSTLQDRKISTVRELIKNGVLVKGAAREFTGGQRGFELNALHDADLALRDDGSIVLLDRGAILNMEKQARAVEEIRRSLKRGLASIDKPVTLPDGSKAQRISFEPLPAFN